MTTKIRYSEPADFFPKEIREKYFADEKEESKKSDIKETQRHKKQSNKKNLKLKIRARKSYFNEILALIFCYF